MMLRLTFTVFFAVLLGCGMYWLGYRQGSSAISHSESSAAVTGQVEGPADERGAGHTAVDSALQGFDEFTALLRAAAWFRLERWLVANADELTPAHGAELIQAVSGKVSKYDAVALRRVMRAYLNALPNDNGALFLLSDLQQMSGMREAALETLFQVLDYPLNNQAAARARRGAEQIISVTDTQLRNRGALAEREALWRHISQRVPGSDLFRYEWANALAGLQRWDEARRVLLETGTSDVAQATLDELRTRIEIAEQGVQFIRDGDRMLSPASIPGGVTLTLLVDTGANVTSLSRSALRSVAARRLEQRVQVRTASGVVSTGVYEVDELEVQGRLFENLRVIELPSEIPGLDGLLGVDILSELSADPLQVRR